MLRQIMFNEYKTVKLISKEMFDELALQSSNRPIDEDQELPSPPLPQGLFHLIKQFSSCYVSSLLIQHVRYYKNSNKMTFNYNIFRLS